MRIGRPPRGTRWLAAAVGVGAAVAAVIVAGPAGAATTVPAQLALTGVVTDKSPTGGSVVGIHPGDAVDFKAAPAGVSTQGLNALGIPLGDLLGGLLGQVVGYQVVVHLPASFPGGQRDVRLGACGGAGDLKVTFPNAGTYNLTWSAYSVTVAPILGTCSLNNLKLDGNQLKQAGIALNASNQWMGQVVVATNPPAGGIGIQVPSVGVHPSAPVVGQLPSAGLPGTTVGGSGGGGGAKPPAGSPTPSPTASGSRPAGSTSGGVNYNPPGQSVEDKTVPKGYGCCDEGSHPSAAGGANSALINQLGGQPVPAQTDNGPAYAAGNNPPFGAPAPTRSGQPINLAANKAPAAQMPVVLAILAIIALSLVTATYSRLYLLRRTVR
jgi:hypothetical protein